MSTSTASRTTSARNGHGAKSTGPTRVCRSYGSSINPTTNLSSLSRKRVCFGPKSFIQRRISPYISRQAVGDPTAVFNVKLSLRNFGLEPHVIHEPKNLASQRADLLDKDFVIEKPK